MDVEERLNYFLQCFYFTNIGKKAYIL